MGYLAFEGSWEEALAHGEEFQGKRVRVEVVPMTWDNPNELPFDEWKKRFDAALVLIDSFKGKIGPVPPDATTTDSLYD